MTSSALCSLEIPLEDGAEECPPDGKISEEVGLAIYV
jgi:hypothetical protein